MTTEAPEKKRRKKKTDEEDQSIEQHEGPKEDRPVHLAPTVLANYFAAVGIELGMTVAGGRIMRSEATCINGSEDSSLWRVNCTSEFDSQHGMRYRPTPYACLRVDGKGTITEVVSD